MLGLGRFGQAVARELTRLGHDVLGIDASERNVQALVDDVTHVVQADITDEGALEDLGIRDFDTVVVAISSNLEASILTTARLKQIGVRRIVAKAANDLHGSILKQVGASRVVYPERETGTRVAHSYAAPGVRDYLNVAPGYGIARFVLPEEFIGRSLADLDLSRAYNVTVIALHRGGTVLLSPHSSEVARKDDELIVAGLDENLERLPGTAGGD